MKFKWLQKIKYLSAGQQWNQQMTYFLHNDKNDFKYKQPQQNDIFPSWKDFKSNVNFRFLSR